MTTLTKTVASVHKSSVDSVPEQPVKNDLTSSAVKSRKRKAILLPDDYQSKSAARKLDKGMFKLRLR